MAATAHVITIGLSPKLNGNIRKCSSNEIVTHSDNPGAS